MFPIMLNLNGRKCLVIGSGPVGCRKATRVLKGGGTVLMVSPTPPTLSTMLGSEKFDWLEDVYRPQHLEGVDLLFAAGPTDVNSQAVIDGRAQKIWVNSATNPEQGDFALPAVHQNRGLTVAVSTEGASPHLASRFLDELSRHCIPEMYTLIEILAEFRPVIRQRIPSIERRSALLAELTQAKWLGCLMASGRESVERQMRLLVDEAAST